MADKFTDTLRRIGADPSALRSRTTVTDAPALMPDARETYVIESVKSEAGSYIFLELIDADGLAHRLVLPPKACAAIYRHRHSLTERSRKRGARAAYATQVAQGRDPPERLRRIHDIGEE